MKLRSVAFILLCLIVLIPGASANAQATDASVRGKQLPQKHAGFLDYALGRINPEQKDYGTEAQNLRRLAVTATIENLYFWLTVSALMLLTGVTTAYILDLRADEKKEFLAASLITELWNGRISDRIEIERRTELYNQLVAQRNAIVETSIARDREITDAEERTESRTQRKIDRLVGGARATPAASSHGKGRAADAPLGFPAVSDLEQQNMLLERRIEAMRNTEQNLRERLNQTTSQLDDERKRNKALKGA